MAKSRKLPVDELLRLACLYAEQDRETLLDSYAGMLDDPAAVEAGGFLAQLRAYRKKRWPGKTLMEVFAEEAKPVSIRDLLNNLNKNSLGDTA